MVDNIVNFSDFRQGKDFEKDYPAFIGHTEKFFVEKMSAESMFKKLFYSLRYVEGTIRAIKTLSMFGIVPELDDKGRTLLIDWLQSMINDLKET